MAIGVNMGMGKLEERDSVDGGWMSGRGRERLGKGVAMRHIALVRGQLIQLYL
jgi:hypothetical protein